MSNVLPLPADSFPLTWGDYQALLTAGVDKRLLAHMYAARGISAAVVDGKRAILLAEGAAFRLEAPAVFWATSPIPFLGEDGLHRSTHFQEPLMVYETPLQWLRAGREGIVILDWQRYWPMYLSGVPVLRAIDPKFGRRLRDGLRRPLSIPDVQVAA